MRIVWFAEAWEDLDRLHAFLAEHDPEAADATFDRLAKAPEALFDFPRRGSRLTRYTPREVREFRVGKYLLRYEINANDIFVLNFFHTREDRL